MEDKRTVRFNVDREVRDHEGRVIATFKANKSYPLEPGSAERWVRRAVADYVDLKAIQPKPLTKKEEAELEARTGGQTDPGSTGGEPPAGAPGADAI